MKIKHYKTRVKAETFYDEAYNWLVRLILDKQPECIIRLV